MRTKEINQKRSVDVIYFDFEKAFDEVLHDKLINRLQHKGIHRRILAIEIPR